MGKQAETKIERNKKIIEWFDNKHRSFGQISKEFQISKTRVSMIYHREKAKALKNKK